jgi:deoxyuridine 5'-triphosphate nucleotidohydrolase
MCFAVYPVSIKTMSYLFGCKCASSTFEHDDEEVYTGYNNHDKLNFWRGYFDTNGTISKAPFEDLKCVLLIKDIKLLPEFQSFMDIPFEMSIVSNDVGTLECVFGGTCAIEFIARIYKEVSTKREDVIELTNNYLKYKQLMYSWSPTHSTNDDTSFKFLRTRQDAIPPRKAHATDSGYDLWLLEKVKEENGMVMYDTGIAVKPPHGYYFELVGRSSISKSGYIMANSVGIIDSSYRGTLKVALIKVNKEMPDLELPCRLVQLIPRQFLHLEAIEVEELDTTERGEGGFGSSG